MDTSIFIGTSIGLAIGLGLTLRTFGWQKKLVAAVDRGDQAGARAILYKHAPAVRKGKSVPMAKLLQQRARVLGLWLLGDRGAVEAELALHSGGAAYVTNVELFGLLALATEPGADVAALVAKLEQGEARVRTEASALQKLLKDYAAMLRGVGVGLVGRPVDPTTVGKLLSKTNNEPVLTRIVVLRALAVAAERIGKPSLELQHRLAQLTSRFTPATGTNAGSAEPPGPS